MSRENPRRLRVAAELQRVANDLLCHEINDPRLSGVRISEVEVSGDLSLARFFFNTLDPDDDPEPVIEALNRASGFMRSRLGRAVRLRRVPELRFAQDIVSRRGIELSKLIDEAVADERAPQGPGPDDAADD